MGVKVVDDMNDVGVPVWLTNEGPTWTDGHGQRDGDG